MKKYLLTLFFISITSLSFSQINEIGIFIGGSNYIGDIGSNNYIYPNKFAGGLIYKYNYNQRMTFRVTYSYLPIKGNDKETSNPYRVQHGGWKFSNIIHELAIGMEFNFFEYNILSDEKSFTPYILVEIAGFNYQSPKLSTKPNTINFKSKNSFAIPFGLGIKGRLSDNITFALEAKVRYTFKDDLDYTTPKIPTLDFGGTGNDWYTFTGISFFYTFGRPSCYASQL